MTPTQYYTLNGTITDATTGWPLYASVEIVPADGYQTATVWTDPWTGAYTATLMGNYTHTLTVAPWDGIPGYISQTRTVTLSAGRAGEDFALNADTGVCRAPGYLPIGFQEGFESGIFPPAGWMQFRGANGLGVVQSLHRKTGAYYEGSGSAIVVHEDVLGGLAQDWLVTSQVRPMPGNTTLSFYMRQKYSVDRGTTYTVRVSTAGQTDHDDFAIVQAYNETDFGTTYQQFTVDLSAYINQDIYIAFVMEQDNGDDWYLDNVRLFNCILPNGGLVAGNVYDQHNAAAITGALVSDQDGYTQTTQTTPDDAVGEGFYILYSPAGSTAIMVTMITYTPTVAHNVPVVAGETGKQDFYLSHLDYPQITPQSLHATVTAGEMFTLTLQVNNDDSASPFTFALKERPTGANGSDVFGYTVLDSFQPGGPTYRWVDATDGVALGLNNDDVANVALPFNFSFYNTTSTRLTVGLNGAVYFGAYDRPIDPFNDSLTASGVAGNRFIAPFWDDLDSDSEGDVYVKTVGTAPNRQFIVEWYDRAHFSLVGAATFELILFESSNDILFQYQDVDFDDEAYNNGVSALVGIRYDAASNLQYSYNAAVLAAEQAILFKPTGIPWLNEVPGSGVISGNGEIAVNVGFDAGAVNQPGEHYGALVVTYDSRYDAVRIPVTLTVLASVYTSTGSGNWSDTGHWQGGPAASPTAVNDVYIAAGSEITVDMPAACNHLTIANGGRLNLAQPLSVRGVVTNDGHLHQVKDVSGIGSVDFIMLDNGSGTIKYYGVTVMSGVSLGLTAVDIYGNQTYGDGTLSQTVMRKYVIAPANESAVTARFYYRDAELNGNVATTLNVYHYAGNAAWDLMPTTARGGSGEARWVDATIGPAYSPFVLKSPATPTAVDVAAVHARSSLLIGFLALVVVGALVVSKRRQ